jgi:phospholipid/cholesterol/gamma-HCH transport system ATP-binding protein
MIVWGSRSEIPPWVDVRVEGLTKSFGRQLIWGDVTLTIPAGEICVMLGPSGTGKSVFLKTLIGLIKPDRGHIHIEGVDIATCSERQLYEVRKLFGVLFQDGAMFGSMNLFDNVAFPLREHTRRPRGRDPLHRDGEDGEDGDGRPGRRRAGPPGEISGGMRKRAGLARALVLEPEILLVDEPDSGLDPVRTAFLNQLFIDLNEASQQTLLIVTHDINTARGKMHLSASGVHVDLEIDKNRQIPADPRAVVANRSAIGEQSSTCSRSPTTRRT